MTELPNSASLSIRSSIVSMGTGSDVLSYSLQYVQLKLHRRIGTMCTRTGCFVEANARVVCLTPRKNRLILLDAGIDQVSDYREPDRVCQINKSSGFVLAGALAIRVSSSIRRFSLHPSDS